MVCTIICISMGSWNKSELSVAIFLFSVMIVCSGIIPDIAKSTRFTDILKMLPLVAVFAFIAFFASKYIKWNKGKK